MTDNSGDIVDTAGGCRYGCSALGAMLLGGLLVIGVGMALVHGMVEAAEEGSWLGAAAAGLLLLGEGLLVWWWFRRPPR